MLKIIIIAFVILVTGCAAIPTVGRGDPRYPNPSALERSNIAAMIWAPSFPSNQRNHAYDVAHNVDLGRMLSESDLALYNDLLLRNQRRLDSVENDRRAQESADRERVELAREKQDIRRQEQEKLMQQQAANRTREQFYAEYESISSPEDAQRFVTKYSGQSDPKNLIGSAMKKGYATGIKNSQDCIDRANGVVKTQKEIGEAVGLIDKSAMYRAGAALVECKKRLIRYQLDSQKFQ